MRKEDWVGITPSEEAHIRRLEMPIKTVPISAKELKYLRWLIPRLSAGVRQEAKAVVLVPGWIQRLRNHHPEKPSYDNIAKLDEQEQKAMDMEAIFEIRRKNKTQ